jgi:hypothetical protein
MDDIRWRIKSECRPKMAVFRRCKLLQLALENLRESCAPAMVRLEVSSFIET